MEQQIFKDFSKYKLVNGTPGMKKYWDIIMEEFDENVFSVIKFDINMPNNASAFFTNSTGFRQTFDNICLRKGAVIIDGYNIKFKNKKEFAIFLHESCHWRHFVMDNGKCISPRLKDIIYTSTMLNNQNIVRDCEYEAGYRSILYDKFYNIFPKSNIVKKVNILNMLNYDLKNQSEEFIKQYINKKIKINQIIDSVNNFLEWEDPKHIISIEKSNSDEIIKSILNMEF